MATLPNIGSMSIVPAQHEFLQLIQRMDAPQQAAFAVWLDGKLAEFKTTGTFSTDMPSSALPTVPPWLTNFLTYEHQLLNPARLDLRMPLTSLTDGLPIKRPKLEENEILHLQRTQQNGYTNFLHNTLVPGLNVASVERQAALAAAASSLASDNGNRMSPRDLKPTVWNGGRPSTNGETTSSPRSNLSSSLSRLSSPSTAEASPCSPHASTTLAATLPNQSLYPLPPGLPPLFVPPLPIPSPLGPTADLQALGAALQQKHSSAFVPTRMSLPQMQNNNLLLLERMRDEALNGGLATHGGPSLPSDPPTLPKPPINQVTVDTTESVPCTARSTVGTPTPQPPTELKAPSPAQLTSQASVSRRIPCPDCNMCFEKTSEYKTHLTNVHGRQIVYPKKREDGKVKWHCALCRHPYRHNKDAHRHYTSKHIAAPYVCNNCNSTFQRRDALQRHIKKMCPARLNQDTTLESSTVTTSTTSTATTQSQM